MQLYRLSLFKSLALLLVLAGCTTASIVNKAMDMSPALNNDVAAEVLGAMNRRADPCEDFYEYACGSWIKKTKLLQPRPQYDKMNYPLGDQIKKEILTLLEGGLQRKKCKASDFYASCLLQFSNRSFNTAPLARFRRMFQKLSSADTFASAVGTLYSQEDLSLFFAPKIYPDQDHPERYALYLDEGSGFSELTRALKDNGTDVTSTASSGLSSFKVMVRACLDAAAKADLIPRVGLARLAENIVDLQLLLLELSSAGDSSKKRRFLNSFPAGLSLRTYLDAAGIEAANLNNSVFVQSPEYFDTISAYFSLAATDPQVKGLLRAYMAYQLVYNLASTGLLGRDLFVAATTPLVGVLPVNIDSELCQTITTRYLGDAVGRAYVEAHFSERRRAVADKMVHEVVDAFDTVLRSQDWLDDQTRAEARRKLSSVGIKIGYSDALDTYENVRITRDNYASNIALARAHLLRKRVSRLGGPIRKSEWSLQPQDVQAQYYPSKNEITVTAGILRRPVFDETLPSAMKYGALGTIVAHELSHGEDNYGRNYDSTGRLRNWWSMQSSAEFESRSKCYVSLYDTYKPRGLDVFVNGTLTLGENLADSNGIKISFLAFQNAMKKRTGQNSRIGLPLQGEDVPLVRPTGDRPSNRALARELTNNQLFFVSWAQSWCSVTQKRQQRYVMARDVHSPGEFRVLGPLSQMKEFADTFQCKRGSTYNPEKRCYLWQW
jgi:putative endopeptidase